MNRKIPVFIFLLAACFATRIQDDESNVFKAPKCLAKENDADGVRQLLLTSKTSHELRCTVQKLILTACLDNNVQMLDALVLAQSNVSVNY